MENYIYRTISPAIERAHQYFPVILVTGARQVGKSTLCRELFRDYTYIDMEDNSTLMKAETDPKTFLQSLGSNVIIDEAQKCEKIFSQIQVEVDNNPGYATF